MPRKKVVVLGGGSGNYIILKGLKKYASRSDDDESLELSAIVTMMDSGGSSGILRDEYGTLPPGDVRRCLVALSDETELVKELFQYRFQTNKHSSLNGHNFGNLFLTALTNILGSEERAILEAQKLLKVRGNVIPVTLDNSNLHAVLENGDIIKGESAINLPRSNSNFKILKVYLEPKAMANPEAIKAIKEADMIIIGPGDLYTSIIPNFLVSGIPEAIKSSKAIKIYNCNIMTKYGETNNFTVGNFFNVVEYYLGKDIINYVAYNTKFPNKKILEKYNEENAECVKFNEKEFKNKKAKLIGEDLILEQNIIRHDPEKIGKVIMDILFHRKIY